MHAPKINNSSANMKLSRSQTPSSGRFIGRLLGPLIETSSIFMKNVLQSLTKNVLIPLGLISAASATDVATQNKFMTH